MANPNHDPHTGRFASGSNVAAASGDHQANQSKPVSPGRQPIRRHGNATSVGTERPRYSVAARDLVIRNRAIDARHFGVEGDMQSRLDKLPMTPKAGLTATPGRFKYQPPKRGA